MRNPTRTWRRHTSIGLTVIIAAGAMFFVGYTAGSLLHWLYNRNTPANDTKPCQQGMTLQPGEACVITIPLILDQPRRRQAGDEL